MKENTNNLRPFLIPLPVTPTPAMKTPRKGLFAEGGTAASNLIDEECEISEKGEGGEEVVIPQEGRIIPVIHMGDEPEGCTSMRALHTPHEDEGNMGKEGYIFLKERIRIKDLNSVIEQVKKNFELAVN
ncbi:Hypothetical predicted protein [Pelobates cultripes]|uniref:Uncharacterized protein n=1 Tax=Pelobates cultripes TaxID=61616 RepID=A0AAD1WLN4_PELCU|nr:Hypothetical predicted protein [Pelobates cultripes]